MAKKKKLTGEEAARAVEILQTMDVSCVLLEPDGKADSTGFADGSGKWQTVGAHLDDCIFPDTVLEMMSTVWTEGKVDFRYRIREGEGTAPVRLELTGGPRTAVGLLTKYPPDDERRMVNTEVMLAQAKELELCANEGLRQLEALRRGSSDPEAWEKVRSSLLRFASDWQEAEVRIPEPDSGE